MFLILGLTGAVGAAEESVPAEPEESGEAPLARAKAAFLERYRAALESADAVDYEKAFEELRGLYRQAREKGEDLSGGIYEWIRRDIAQYNTWEYTVLTVAAGDDEAMAAEMNALGAERWECIGAYMQKNRLTLIFKRRPITYLRRIPAGDLMRLFGVGTWGGE